jgi:dCMP deaminase
MADVKTSRPSLDEYFLNIAKVTATRSTCRHRQQGAVLVRDNRIISCGYNGSPPGMPHCIDLDCAKAQGAPCRAEGLHGETNAVASAARMGISTKDAVCYCIYSPCLACCNLLKTAGIKEVVYSEVYSGYPEGPVYLDRLGVRSRMYPLTVHLTVCP